MQSPPANRDGEQQTHGGSDLARRHDLTDPTGYFALTRNEIPAFDRHHQAPKQHRRSSTCPKGP